MRQLIKTPKPILLLILDGWGYRKEVSHNPCRQAYTPFIDFLFQHYPHRLLQASGEAVGLPRGQIGNSEVGHLHIGAGRQVRQELTRIDDAIKRGALAKNTVLLEAINKLKKTQCAVHLLGLLSEGGVHSHENHIKAIIKILAQYQIPCYLHAFLDGRDVPPRSAKASLKAIQALFSATQTGAIVSICGRYYAMDRDQRWQRTQKAYDLITQGCSDYQAPSAIEGLEAAYQRGESDEFVKPTWIQSSAIKGMGEGDMTLFMNFRADRARQLSEALTATDFQGFRRNCSVHLLDHLTLVPYTKSIKAAVLFPKSPLKNTLGAVIAQHDLHQLRVAETEKYAHVTYFLNGGQQEPNDHEKRILVPSPKVSTYDLAPAMSADVLTDKLTQAILAQHYDVIICNYANPDMLGHTGVEKAAVEAMQVIDQCLERVINAVKKVQGEALISADHGNIECLYDEMTHQAHTAHTTNLVPLIYVGRKAQFDAHPAALYDIAPTLLQLLNVKKPKEMTGRPLLHFIGAYLK